MRAAVLGGKAKDLALVSARKIGNLPRKLAGESKQALEGNILAVWDEVNLVVAPYAGAIRAHDQRGVEITPAAVLRREICPNVAHHQRRLLLPGNGHECLLKLRVSFLKWGWRLRPHHQVRMRRIGWADNLAIRRAGLGDSGDVGFALLAGQLGEFGNMLVPLAGAQPAVVASHVQIGLDQHGAGGRRGPGRLHGHARRTHHQQDGPGDARRQPPGTAVQEEPPGDQRIDENQHKADAVDPGPGRELIDQTVVHLRVAQLIPGNAGDARCGQLQPGPQDGRRSQRQPRASGCLPHQHDAKAEEPEVEPQHQAVSHQQQRRRKWRHVAVPEHDIAHPVAISRVPQEAAKVGQKKGSPQGARLLRRGL